MNVKNDNFIKLKNVLKKILGQHYPYPCPRFQKAQRCITDLRIQICIRFVSEHHKRKPLYTLLCQTICHPICASMNMQKGHLRPHTPKLSLSIHRRDHLPCRSTSSNNLQRPLEVGYGQASQIPTVNANNSSSFITWILVRLN